MSDQQEPAQQEPTAVTDHAPAPGARAAPPPRRSLGARARPLLAALFTLRADRSRARVVLVMAVFGVGYGVIAGRLVQLALRPDEPTAYRRAATEGLASARPPILDRNGELLATDIPMTSLFAEPRKILDKDEATELLNAVFPEMNGKELRQKLGSGKGFAWLKREITPRQQEAVMRLGIPGVGFLPEKRRVYPNGPVGAHVLGFANVDNHGIAGIEKWIDGQGLGDLMSAGLPTSGADMAPVKLSLDLRATHGLREELVKGMERYKAKAAAGAIMDVNTGEVVALASLPDYDPNTPVDALDPNHINRLAVGVYEMGSTFKALTVAMALDSGKANINSTFDARSNLRYGRFTIHDYHGTGRVLTVPEVFVHSSNIGTARMAMGVGVEGHKAFLRKLGQLTRMRTELPESAEPIVPRRWVELNTMTIAFGHGLAVAPLQAMSAVAALVNGGKWVPATFLKRSPEEADKLATQVVKPETSEAMRFIFRLNAEKGSARKADVAGYYVGGKTGTAEKVVGGRYAKNRLFTTFMAVMPADKPRYLFLTTFDEPQGTKETHGFATAAWNAGVVTGRIVERVGPMLDVTPRFEPPVAPFPLMARLGAWGTR